MDNYHDNDLIFKVIKSSGKIKELSKSQCVLRSNYICRKILNEISSKVGSRQIKIFAIIGSSEESAILMLSSLKLKAHQCICFEELSEEAIRTRFEIFQPDIVLYRKNIEKKVKIFQDKGNEKGIPFMLVDLNNFESNKEVNQLKEIESLSYEIDDNLFTLFTSGSTGLPKAIVHGVIPYLDYAKFSTEYFFGLRKNSIMFTATDAGWINGHTYAFYGPLLIGSQSIICENQTFLSIPRFLAQYLYQLNVSCFYTSVTILRLLKKVSKPQQTINHFLENQLSLERIGSCGEPLAHEVGKWAIEYFQPQRKTIVNTYFQTETGGVLVAPRDEDGIPNDYSCVGKPRESLGLSIASEVLGSKDLEENNIDPNELIIKNHWDGLFKEVISDRETNYFSSLGHFRLHDVGYLDQEGFLYIGGRSDDVINTSGHRISSSEIENISLNVEGVDEACAVAIDDQLSGAKPILFVSTTLEDNEFNSLIKSKIINQIERNLSTYHIPKEIYSFLNLPKTRSGKIMRRVMRDIACDIHFNKNCDYSTLANKKDFIQSQKRHFQKTIEYHLENIKPYDFEYNFKVSRILKNIYKYCQRFSLSLDEEIDSKRYLSLQVNLENTVGKKIILEFDISKNSNFNTFENQLINFFIKDEINIIDINYGTIKLIKKDRTQDLYIFVNHKEPRTAFKISLYNPSDLSNIENFLQILEDIKIS